MFFEGFLRGLCFLIKLRENFGVTSGSASPEWVSWGTQKSLLGIVEPKQKLILR